MYLTTPLDDYMLGTMSTAEAITALDALTPAARLGKADYQCGACGLIFASDQAFSHHRTGHPNNRHCLTLDELLAKRRKTGDPQLERDPKGRIREVRLAPVLAATP